MRRSCLPACAFGTTLLGLLLAGSGCASMRRSVGTPVPFEPQAIVVEGELVRPTGSRISRIVPKDGRAGVARDMPGFNAGPGLIAREQNDMLPQLPLGR